MTNEGEQNQGDQGTQQNQDTPKTFTQDEVNAIAGRARTEERQKFSDYDDLKGRAARADELEQAQMTAQERLEKQLADEQRKNIDADERITTTMITSEIRVQSMQKGIVDPEAAVALMERTGVSYTEDGGVVGVTEALDALIVAKPYLKGQVMVPNVNAGNNTPADQPAALTQDQRDAAKMLGLEEADYAKGLIPNRG